MKTRLIGIVLLLVTLAAPLAAQAVPESTLPSQWAGVSVYYNQFAAPQINGAMTYAKKILTAKTYLWNSINFLSYDRNPFRVMTAPETGLAQHLTDFGPFSVFVLGQAGIAVTGEESGTKTGMTLTTGGFAFAGFRNGVTIGPVLRITKPTISDTQWSLGLCIGWGK